MLARASLAASVSATSWMLARAGDLAQTVQDGHAMASPRIRAALDVVYAQLWMLSSEARRIAERQGEQAAFLAIRLNAQAKGEIDALKRAVREGRLTTPQWRKVASVAFFRDGAANEHKGEEGPSEPAAGSTSSRNALITVEPWRCRLPVVRGNGSSALAG
jgi:hypothetical protein